MSTLKETTKPPVLSKTRCFPPICGQHLYGECVGMKCVPPHERPDDPNILLVKLTAEQTEIAQEKADQEAIQKAATLSEKFRPDARFWLGIGLGLLGVYLLTNRKKKSG